MALVSLNCPNCGGSLKMEDTMEKGFCMYCGTSIIVRDEIQRVQVEHSGTVNLILNREIEVDNLLIRAEQKIEEYKNQGYDIDDYCSNIINDYLEKALDIDPKSSKVQEMKKSLISEQIGKHERLAEQLRIVEQQRIEKQRIFDQKNEKQMLEKQRIEERDKLYNKIAISVIALLIIGWIVWCISFF